jgi:hypothetical protein
MTIAYLAFSLAFALAGQFLDAHTTEVALANGWTETNKLAAKVIAKTSTTVLTAIKCIGCAQLLPVAAYAIGGKEPGMIAVALASGVWGFWAGIKNYKLLKARKISTF